MSSFAPAAWCIDSLCTPAKFRLPGVPEAVRQARFPFRLLRYWFMHEALRAEGLRRAGGRFEVTEIGLDVGQMLAFSRDTLAHRGEPLPWTRWSGLDCQPQWDALRAAGYDEVACIDLDLPEQLAARPAGSCDAIVLLHVLEHLHDPLPALQGLARWLRPGGLVLAGTPCTPEFARAWWERRLRARARPRGHVSVISPQRVRDWGDALALETEWLAGAFFMRRKGNPLENQAWWLRANLAFGRRFPGWPGEIYWGWRKPAAG
ncbi:class I SAM-dependent methyltransferase [Piscinibacter sakaiensis]|uniref:SAM-dependent methyltransferase n=1 Tax=Piscinibacter sakaiensis TaxID=1547922 RepID=A0A0K8NX54_PISS1|nr:class I SAM-dependent methyltransferase [Piscinibacter sakaiensis]GAP34961.1 hypothetical protein ISF6_0511 [Piscinibacter sakaiensis]